MKRGDLELVGPLLTINKGNGRELKASLSVQQDSGSDNYSVGA